MRAEPTNNRTAGIDSYHSPMLTFCCNLSDGVALIVWFTTNGMCAKNKNTCMWREQAIIEWCRWSDLGEWPLIMLVNLVNSWLCLLTVTTKVISSGDLYCCLLPWCEALHTCRLRFPIATVQTIYFDSGHLWHEEKVRYGMKMYEQ